MRLPPFKIEEFFERHEFKASYLLCCSDCESFSVEELLHFEPEVWQSFGKHWLGYTETHGSPELRNEIVGLYRQISAENVLVHSGGEEGIFVFMNAVLTKGDHVIIHYPCYQSLREVPRAIGCEVTKWVTREEDGWELDIDFLEQNIRENTRAIIINCPHNPTGYLMSHEKFSQV
ncbi:aminotransferase class I/II-fold pyridoxal phosphate-dependent enzyme, partial [candidate division KSB1 bacterium]|nr:aminotransferase class I/II-fold pyridoxal phosphate-dependent enzyme [candidate division KSB1 bacterium]NIT74557.1 aminotransferase class I/II-fold pyridoxal phosphate-dependent enzyme [candidate division KSB1 bacterium]NIU28384.1 aminotransferase class I/II-fold pyridoxal phosphate-dependent enzyme [candidate division KSB1 bacterium]NIU90485.1 aminotransferase class I/II-fold pyridoxal phosphate-dependent enzyme [candidate division KSB1 bacterium]NIW22306.1 aminotransferase class I/II-fold